MRRQTNTAIPDQMVRRNCSGLLVNGTTSSIIMGARATPKVEVDRTFVDGVRRMRVGPLHAAAVSSARSYYIGADSFTLFPVITSYRLSEM